MTSDSAMYLVNHGKTGALGRFSSSVQERFTRGDRVVLESERGLSVGVVLCEARDRHARLLPGDASGRLLRRVGPQDDKRSSEARAQEKQAFEESRRIVAELSLPMEILDVEASLDGRRVIVQHLLAGDCDLRELLDRLSARFGAEFWLEDLATRTADEHSGGCGEPDCGRANGKSGCDTCGTGGGCTSCGSGKVDMREYFAHLREKMELKRTPLL